MTLSRAVSARQLYPYVCETCGCYFVAVTEETAGEQNPELEEAAPCACGGKLRAVELAVGMYKAVPCSSESTLAHPKAKPAGSSRPAEGAEADLGYGKSHGYEPGHGGPTGPGDAPASETEDVRPK
jgi:hypothetical protein